jgi:hypothetical protein
MTKQDFSDEQKLENRQRYLRSRTGDLTSYAALIGESFAARINLLAQILRDVHDPSLGRYKERLLIEFISQFIPRRYDVGSGFVLFPTERFFESETPDGYDILNRSDHTVSHQCDVIVYDSSDFPVVFRDQDFVVVRPESVCSVIEVKGTLDHRQIESSVMKFIDFGRKWKRCNEFYIARHEPPSKTPGLFMVGWQIGVDTGGKLKTDGKRLREQIVRIYRREVCEEELGGFPILDSAFIYADCEVRRVIDVGQQPFRIGFGTYRGRFVRFTDDGEAILESDKTVASLLAGIHWSLETPFNRFFSYADQTIRTDIYPHQHQGFTPWLEGDDVIGLVD